MKISNPLFSAVLTVRGEYKQAHQTVYFFKPLTMLFILSIAAFSQNSIWYPYKVWIVTGLCFSLMGDIFLMLRSDRFVHGLTSFLIAHIFYILAFLTGFSPSFSSISLILPFAFGCAFYLYLYPGLGNFAVPVLVYTVVILAMVWLAFSQWFYLSTEAGLFAMIGAGLFALSDSILAFDRFKRPFKQARFLVLSTYFCAQWLLALSVT